MRQSFDFTVDEETAARRLDEFLSARLGQLSRIRIAKLIAAGACLLNGSLPSSAGQRLKAGDRLRIEFDEAGPSAMTPEPLPLDILYEDAQLLVLVKPTGMLVHPTRGVKSGTLTNALTYHLNQSSPAGYASQSDEHDAARKPATQSQSIGDANPEADISIPQRVVRPGLVHRLDRATSGLMVVAKEQRALSILTRHFHQRLVEKRYLALVGGRVAEEGLTIRAPIGRDAEGQPHWRVMEEGREAETRLRVLERKAGLTLVELEPVTGRTNQLRIHCAHIGHPILGDELYGGAQAARLCLHASRLAFHHPSGGRWMEFVSLLPPEVREILAGAK